MTDNNKYRNPMVNIIAEEGSSVVINQTFSSNDEKE